MSVVPLSLDNKVALITGGSRGIGAAAVRIFRQAGARVAFSYRSAASEAQALQQECGGPEVCLAIQQELRTAADGQQLVDAAVQHFGALHAMVANHGIWPPHDQPIATMTDEQWSTTVGVNLDSVFGLIRASAAQMQQQREGNIVLVSSTAGQRGEAFHADYAATKGALISMTKGLSTELARDNIRVNCVAPGWVPHRHDSRYSHRSNHV